MSKVAIIMGSDSDYATMQHAEDILRDFGVDYSIEVVSAHRTPDRMYEFATHAHQDGVAIIIAGAGGAAHLPGMVSALTHLPVLGVPIESKALSGMDSLLSIVQMPAGVPTATFAIGKAGATNAALFAIQILSAHDPELLEKIRDYRRDRHDSAIKSSENVRRRFEDA
jgi:5-(carboxyamino)imidazole ribonucleotide mutase